MLHGRRAAILLRRRRSRGLLCLVRRVLGVRLGFWARLRLRLRLLCGGGRCRRRHVDFDVSDGVSLDIVRVEAVAACRKEHYTQQSANTEEPGLNSARSSASTRVRRARRRTILQGQGGILRVNGRDHAVYERVWRVLQRHDDRDSNEARRHGRCSGRARARAGVLRVVALTTSQAGGVGGVIVCRPSLPPDITFSRLQGLNAKHFQPQTARRNAACCHNATPVAVHVCFTMNLRALGCFNSEWSDTLLEVPNESDAALR